MSDGRSIIIKGEVAGDEDLAITGRIEGRVRLLNGHVLTLGPESHVVGEIVAGTVVVGGRVDGNVAAGARLDVRATAIIDGDLMAPALVMADGAQINGRIEVPASERTIARAVASCEETPALAASHPVHTEETPASASLSRAASARTGKTRSRAIAPLQVAPSSVS